MRRRGRWFWGICPLLAIFAIIAAPRVVWASYPVIAVPVNLEQHPVEVQPLLGFRAPEPFLTTKSNSADPAATSLKLFLSDRSLLENEPSRGPVLGVKMATQIAAASIDATPAVSLSLSFEAVSDNAPKLPPVMPNEVADAVKALLAKPSSATSKPQTPAPTPESVRNAVDLLNGKVAVAKPTAKPPIQDFEFNDPQRELKIAAVNQAIAALNQSISAKSDVEVLPIVVAAAAPPPTKKRSGEEEQDGTRSAIAKAAAHLLGQLPEPPTRLPDSIPVTNLPPAPPAPAGGSCSNCGSSRLMRPLHRVGEYGHSGSSGGCATCSGGWRCSPGRTPCQPCEAHDGPFGRLFCDFYECLCCPDPCYEGHWNQVANASIFVDGARPMTQTEIRWNASRGGVFPDRSEFIWARADGMGKGPRPPVGRRGEHQFDFDDLTLITETAKDKLSAIIEMPYRSVSPDNYIHGSGFGDMAIGTKTLLFDCELLQVSMMLKTYIPIGNVTKGVGNGHVTIEPSLLFALKLTQDTYLQGQVSEWIPIGGDPIYAGSVLHTHSSLNHVVHRFGPEIPLVGTFELNTFSFQDGAYTDDTNGPYQKSSGTTYVSLGPGLRLFFCDKLDIGFGSAIAVTGDHFSREYYRTSIRLRF